MKRQSPNQPPCLRRPSDASRRTGFTLVELLVVISLIAVMAALSLRVIVGFVTLGRESATKTTIQKIQRILDSRMQAFQRKFGNNDASTVARLKNTTEWQLTDSLRVTDSNGNPVPLNSNQRLIAARKLLYIKYFPQSCWEVDLALQPQLAGYRYQLENQANGGDIESSTSVSNLTNAEVLYDLTVNAASLGDAPVGTDTFLTSEFADLDGDGYPEFIDAWRRPIRFYRWPVMLFRTDADNNGNYLDDPPIDTYARLMVNNLPPSNAFVNQLARDPQDPLGQLANPAVIDLLSGGTEITRPNPPYKNNRRVAPAGFCLPATFHVPLIVSAGPDGEYGMLEPVFGPTKDPDTNPAWYQGYLGKLAPNAMDTLADNICSLNIRAGGN